MGINWIIDEQIQNKAGEDEKSHGFELPSHCHFTVAEYAMSLQHLPRADWRIGGRGRLSRIKIRNVLSMSMNAFWSLAPWGGGKVGHNYRNLTNQVATNTCVQSRPFWVSFLNLMYEHWNFILSFGRGVRLMSLTMPTSSLWRWRYII